MRSKEVIPNTNPEVIAWFGELDVECQKVDWRSAPVIGWCVQPEDEDAYTSVEPLVVFPDGTVREIKVDEDAYCPEFDCGEMRFRGVGTTKPMSDYDLARDFCVSETLSKLRNLARELKPYAVSGTAVPANTLYKQFQLIEVRADNWQLTDGAKAFVEKDGQVNYIAPGAFNYFYDIVLTEYPGADPAKYVVKPRQEPA